jgi:uncharacterized protein YndB with AHSA1/START domain
MTTTRTLGQVKRSVTVRCDPVTAFEVFTTRMGSWWPLDVHSIAVERETGRQAVDVLFESFVGGEVAEVTEHGARGHWATVLAIEPPHRLVLAWQPNADRPTHTELELRFTAADGGTLVELEHRGWERLGDGGEPARAGYAADDGWVTTLQRFAEAVARI